MRCEEIYEASINDVKQNGPVITVHVPKTKTKKPRRFTIDDEKYTAVIGKYIDGRRSSSHSGSEFFLNWQRGRCTGQRIGQNKIYGMPRVIAEFLNLPDAKRYTGKYL